MAIQMMPRQSMLAAGAHYELNHRVDPIEALALGRISRKSNPELPEAPTDMLIFNSHVRQPHSSSRPNPIGLGARQIMSPELSSKPVSIAL